MRKNVASQHVAGQMNARADGSPLTTAVSIFVTVDAGAQGAGGGTLAHKGNGAWDYIPTQAETNGNQVAFTFVHATGVNQTLNVYPVAYDPADAVHLGLGALPNAAAGAAGGLPVSAAGGLNLDVKLANTQEITAARMGALTDWIDAGRLDLLLDAIKAKTDLGLLNTTWTDAKAAFLDVLISSRLAAVGYTAPDNAGIASINGRLPTDPADESSIQGALATIAGYIDTEIQDIRNRLPAALVAGKMDATVDKTGYSLSAAGITAVWAEVLEAALSAAALLRILLAAAAGISSDDGKEFLDVAGAKKRIDGAMSGKDRTVVVLDGTP